MDFNFDHLSNNFKGIILAIVGFSAFAIGDSLTKYLTGHYSVFEIVGIKALFVMILILLLSRFLGGIRKTVTTQKRKTQILRGLVNTALGVAAIFSFAKLPLAQAYTLFFFAPILTTLISIPVFKEHVSRHGWMAIIFGFIGVLVVLRPGISEFDPWLLVALLSSFFIALMFLLAKALDENETLLSLPFFPAASDLVLILPFVWTIIFYLSPIHVLIFAVSSAMILIGYLGVSLAFRMANSSVVGPFHYTQIIWAIAFGYIFFSETPDIWTLLGAAIIIASGIYLIETERKHMKLEAGHI